MKSALKKAQFNDTYALIRAASSARDAYNNNKIEIEGLSLVQHTKGTRTSGRRVILTLRVCLFGTSREQGRNRGREKRLRAAGPARRNEDGMQCE